MPDKPTDNEVIKALEDWIKNYNGSCVNFKTLGNALAFINRQKAEIERLQLEKADVERDLRVVLDNSVSAKYPHCVLCGNGAILTKSLDEYDKLIADISAEAIKEFAERLKERYSSVWTHDGHEEAVLVLHKSLDNLVKEMVGEE